MPAVLFDLYNTLVAFSFTGYAAVVAQMAATLGLPELDFVRHWQATWAQHEVGSFTTVGIHISHVCATLNHTVETAKVRMAEEIHYNYQQQLLIPTDEAVALLTLLRQRGYQTGVITNCPLETPQLWQTSLLAPLIDVAVFSPIQQVRKLDAALFMVACQQLGKEPNECMMVGDSWPIDVLGAHHAGLAAVWLNPQGVACPEPTIAPSIASLADLVDLLPSF